MKKLLMIFVLIFSVLVSAVAQSSTNKQTSTTPPEQGKFEIITSSIALRETYLLNKETGETWQLVSTRTGYAWEKIYKNANPTDKIPDGFKGAVYQITMSGIAVKGTYLINTLTGATWTLYKDSETDELFWGVVESPLY